MTKETTNIGTLTTQQAIDKALQAERDSLRVIAECEAEAERILSQARKVAHHISERADDRISLVHQRCKHAADNEIKRLQELAATAANNGNELQLDHPTIDRVAGLLAESLTVSNDALKRSE